MTGTPSNDFWNSRFSEGGYAYGERASRLLMAHMDTFSEGQTALVPACGEGRDAVFLARMGLEVTAVDLSAVALEKGVTLASQHGVTVDWQHADLSTWEWPTEAYDVVASIFLHTPKAMRPNLHANLLNALKPNGHLFLEGFTPEQIEYQKSHNSGGPQNVDMLFTQALIQNDFAKAESRAMWTGIEHLEEGTYHTGPAALIRAIFKKIGA